MKNKDFWLCNCGTMNLASDENCSACKASKISKLDGQSFGEYLRHVPGLVLVGVSMTILGVLLINLPIGIALSVTVLMGFISDWGSRSISPSPSQTEASKSR